MTAEEIIRAAMPEASPEDVEHVLWGMTPHPVATVTARYLYRAASRFQRARQNNIRLCDFCERPARATVSTCYRCSRALEDDRAS